MKKLTRYLIVAICFAMLSSGCEKDEPKENENKEEKEKITFIHTLWEGELIRTAGETFKISISFESEDRGYYFINSDDCGPIKYTFNGKILAITRPGSMYTLFGNWWLIESESDKDNLRLENRIEDQKHKQILILKRNKSI